MVAKGYRVLLESLEKIYKGECYEENFSLTCKTGQKKDAD